MVAASSRSTHGSVAGSAGAGGVGLVLVGAGAGGVGLVLVGAGGVTFSASLLSFAADIVGTVVL